MRTLLVTGLALGLLAGPLLAQEEEPEARPQVDVVFVLDTTGSMGGLIEGAKQKIWSIVNQIASGKPGPEVRVGLVAYRDKGDQYVTTKVDLTDDLDKMYEALTGYQADGGGDGPEHVNEGLRVGVEEMSWNGDRRVLKIVFLVGDAPPHMDYDDDVEYMATCESAVEKDILINTVRCGADEETARVWADIAERSEGRFVSIAQDGGVVNIETPFDDQLADLNRELNGTFVFFGSDEQRNEAEEKLADSDDRAGAAGAPASSARALYKARKSLEAGSSYTRGDLVTESKDEKFDLGALKEEDLPENMKAMTEEERKAYLDEMAAKRAEIQSRIEETGRQRDGFIKDELAKRGQEKTGFDAQVFEMIKEQGSRKGIEYADE